MKKIKQIIAIMIFFSIPIWMTAQPPHPNNGDVFRDPEIQPLVVLLVAPRSMADSASSSQWG
jgi:hypothetical protein